MKKLTAGIFATILGLTAVDAFAAVPADMTKVATTNYVAGALNAAKSYTDSAVANKADKSTTYTKTEVDELVGGVNTSLSGYVTTQTYNTDQAAQNTAIQAADAKGAQGITDAAAAKAAADAAQAAAEAADAKAVAADGKAQTAQDEVDALELVVANKADKSTTYTKTEVDELVGGVNTSLSGYVTTQTYNTDQAAQNTAIQAADAKGAQGITDAAAAKAAAEAADAKAVAAQGEVDALELVVADKANASDLTGYVAWTDVENEYPTQQ